MESSSYSKIAEHLGVSTSTISREVRHNRNPETGVYNYLRANERAKERQCKTINNRINPLVIWRVKT